MICSAPLIFRQLVSGAKGGLQQAKVTVRRGDWLVVRLVECTNGLMVLTGKCRCVGHGLLTLGWQLTGNRDRLPLGSWANEKIDGR
jgi:hypothetical protein